VKSDVRFVFEWPLVKKKKFESKLKYGLLSVLKKENSARLTDNVN